MPALDLPHRSEKLQSLTDGAVLIPLATDLGAKILAGNRAGLRLRVVRALPAGESARAVTGTVGFRCFADGAGNPQPPAKIL